MATDDLRSRLRDPWQVAPLLIALIGILALLFPKPERPPAEADPSRVRTPPPGMSLALLSDPQAVTCQRAGDAAAKDCALLGAEGGMVYHLEATWPLAALRQAHKGETLVIEGARLDLLENHQAHYTGPIQVRTASGAVVAEGGRVDNRTLRAPQTEAPSAALDAEVTRWLAEGMDVSERLRVEVDGTVESSIDEYTPQLSFFYRAE